MPSTVDKKKLKTVFLRKRKMLSESEWDRRNAQILYHFSQLIDTLKVDIIHCFLPIKKNREVDTWAIINYLKSSDKKIIVSKSNEYDNSMVHYEYQDQKQLQLSKWGIPEPVNGLSVESSHIDAVLVPLIVFDQKGHRIGYGKGYYDRFLSECRRDCLKIGLSLSPPLDVIPYTESHDIPLDYCLTHHRIFDFQK